MYVYVIYFLPIFPQLETISTSQENGKYIAIYSLIGMSHGREQRHTVPYTQRNLSRMMRNSSHWFHFYSDIAVLFENAHFEGRGAHISHEESLSPALLSFSFRKENNIFIDTMNSMQHTLITLAPPPDPSSFLTTKRPSVHPFLPLSPHWVTVRVGHLALGLNWPFLSHWNQMPVATREWDMVLTSPCSCWDFAWL